MKIVTVEQMQEIERQTDERGVTYDAMMQNAGSALVEEITKRFMVEDTSIFILVGPGNNGGDGLVAAANLFDLGARVQVFLATERKPDANLALLEDKMINTVVWKDDESYRQLEELVSGCEIFVDALLGTGVDRPLEGRFAEILNVCNRALDSNARAREIDEREYGIPFVVAVDCPSGLNCDTGKVDERTLPANLTVTFAALKRGLIEFPGIDYAGEIVIADIGCPPDIAVWNKIEIDLITDEWVEDILPERPDSANKGIFGKLLVVGGSANYVGAPVLAANGAYRAGVGLVTLAIPSLIHGAVAAQSLESTFLLLPHSLGAIVPAAATVISSDSKDYSSMVIGPGLGKDEKTAKFLHAMLSLESKSFSKMGFIGKETTAPKKAQLPPLILDADALNILAISNESLLNLPENSVLTPHPGEMARLLGTEVESIQERRIEIAREAAEKWRQVVVLKGAFTVVASPNGCAAVAPFANSALATAGTGDVLAGVIGAMMAQGLDAYEAAVAGVFLHGLAGQLAADERGSAGVVAGDVAYFVAEAIELLQ